MNSENPASEESAELGEQSAPEAESSQPATGRKSLQPVALAMGGVAVVIVAILLIVLATGGFENDSKSDTKNPAATNYQADVTLCLIGADGVPSAKFQITNTANAAQTYDVVVEFAGVGVDATTSEKVQVRDVAPGETRSESVTGSTLGATDRGTCRLSSVTAAKR